MNTRLRAWPSASTTGVGPAIVALTLVSIMAGEVVTALAPALRIQPLQDGWARIIGAALLVLAAALYVPLITAVRIAAGKGSLLTTGPYAYVRDPIYAVFVFLACPGLALLVASWPAVLSPFVGYALYRALIPREEAVLRARFGEEYEAYRRGVGGLVPRAGRRG
jgi:protein-S-isoprenylcysteine O-methyltransferase Ste14